VLYNESGCGGWIELLDPALEGFLELRVVLLRVLTGELDDFAIAVSGLFVLTASLVHNAQAIVTIVHLRDLSNDSDRGFAESLMRIFWNPSRTRFGDGVDLRSPSAALCTSHSGL
jgi:hypothetical protein